MIDSLNNAKHSNAQVPTSMVLQAQGGDTAAATNLVLNMNGHVANWAREIAGKHHVEETTLEGLTALWEAVQTFDPERGASFYTHARRVVRLAMHNVVSNNNDGPTVHERTARRYFALVREANGDIDQAAAMADEGDRNFSTSTFWAAHRALDNTERLDRQATDDEAASAMDEASQRSSVDVEADAINRVITADLLASLTERQAAILERTYGLNGHTEHTDNETAQALGISRPRVVTIRKAALSSLASTNPSLKGMI